MARARREVAGWEKKSDTPQREYKSVSFVLESADENTGEFSGYAAVFGNVDSGGDVIEKGAFAKTIVEDFARIKILSQHNSYDLPIGKPLELREDEKGLYIRGKISDTQTGRDIRTLLKDGVLAELSIGYDAVDFEASYINTLTSTEPNSTRIPMVLANDKEVFQACIKLCGQVDPANIRMVIIRSTKYLDEVYMSKAAVEAAVMPVEPMRTETWCCSPGIKFSARSFRTREGGSVLIRRKTDWKTYHCT